MWLSKYINGKDGHVNLRILSRGGVLFSLRLRSIGYLLASFHRALDEKAGKGLIWQWRKLTGPRLRLG